jgi:single-strand DNA-binding protein
MANGLNKVMLIGNLGKDPETKFTEKGSSYCRFSLATNESYKNDKGEKVERTEWHDIVAWKKLGELCQTYLKKGSKIYAEGKLQSYSYEKEGVKKKSWSVVLNDFAMLDSKPKDQSANIPDTNTNHPAETNSGDDDLPF